MFTNHQRSDLLHEYQKKLYADKIVNEPFSVERKKLLDDALVDCIIEDSRPLSDFKKKA